jgi:hypothetical protein
LDQVNLAFFSTDVILESTTYEEALNCERKEDQINWKDALDKELKEMAKRGVWEVIDEKDVRINR